MYIDARDQLPGDAQRRDMRRLFLVLIATEFVIAVLFLFTLHVSTKQIVEIVENVIREVVRVRRFVYSMSQPLIESVAGIAVVLWITKSVYIIRDMLKKTKDKKTFQKMIELVYEIAKYGAAPAVLVMISGVTFYLGENASLLRELAQHLIHSIGVANLQLNQELDNSTYGISRILIESSADVEKRLNALEVSVGSINKSVNTIKDALSSLYSEHRILRQSLSDRGTLPYVGTDSGAGSLGSR